MNFDNSYARLPGNFFSRVVPAVVSSPEIVVFNNELAAELELDSKLLNSSEGANIFAGKKIPAGADPIALAYAGHQFANFVILGDGRAHLPGEHVTSQGRRFDIQLKGSGQTPYSRRGDGKATLGPMLREYLISEAMHALRIPTTRSLAVVTTGESVIREGVLPGAILTRVAASHIRVGTFELFLAKRDLASLKLLADYAINRHYPEIENNENKYVEFLRAVTFRQAKLIAQWLEVGFIHGVMNTDNMAISGETIDYGPCAFMNEFDYQTVFSSIDVNGRYAYGNQPAIGLWNLSRFAECLLSLFGGGESEAVSKAEEVLEEFPKELQRCWLSAMRKKIGLREQRDEDAVLIDELLQLLSLHKKDYTQTFLDLSLALRTETPSASSEYLTAWISRWKHRLNDEGAPHPAALQLMATANPLVIPRNHRVEEALEAAVSQRDLSLFHQLLQVVQNPFVMTTVTEEYQRLPDQNLPRYQTFCGT